ncbi:unnamed protein product [Brassica rapa subsp. trilocularis]
MTKVAGVNLTSGFGLFGDSLYLFTLFYISLSCRCECVGVREKIDNTFDRDSTVT